MTNKIHTIQSSDKKEFDKKVNEFLEMGCELMEGGYLEDDFWFHDQDSWQINIILRL